MLLKEAFIFFLLSALWKQCIGAKYCSFKHDLLRTCTSTQHSKTNVYMLMLCSFRNKAKLANITFLYCFVTFQQKFVLNSTLGFPVILIGNFPVTYRQ
jgi:hypothetical protein